MAAIGWVEVTNVSRQWQRGRVYIGYVRTDIYVTKRSQYASEMGLKPRQLFFSNERHGTRPPLPGVRLVQLS